MLQYFVSSFVHKEIRQPNEAQTFRRIVHENVTYRIEVKAVDQSLECLCSEVHVHVIDVLLCAVFSIQKSISVTWPISRADLHLQFCSQSASGIYKFIFRQMFKDGSLT